MLSSGVSYEQKYVKPSFERPLNANVCVFPNEEQTTTLAKYIKSKDLECVSIGCGEGLLEGLLEAFSIKTTAVDLDFAPKSAYPQMRRFCTTINRVASRQLYAIKNPRKTCLLVCFGKRVPLLKYLLAFPAIPSVVIIGDYEDSGVCSPPCNLLENEEGWTKAWSMPVRATMAADMVAYEQKGAQTPVDIDAI